MNKAQIAELIKKTIEQEGLSLHHEMIVGLIEGDEDSLRAVEKFNTYIEEDQLHKALKAHKGKKIISPKGIRALAHIPVRYEL